MIVSQGELEAVLECFNKDKSLGPDKWPMEFYSTFIEFIGPDLLLDIEECIITGSMHDGFNSTFLTLIPKFDKRPTFDDYRPISLCNCVYKIISKTIAKRVKPILSRMISKEQFAFLSNRQIHEAIGTAQEGLHLIKK